MSKTASKTGKMLILDLEIFTHVYLEDNIFLWFINIV